MKTLVKIVTVLAVYKFKNVARICFTVLSSNGSDRYHVCFQGNGRESCDCPSTSKKGCYHLNGLRARAQAYFESQKQQALAAPDFSNISTDDLIAEKKSIVESWGMYIMGRLPLTPEQAAKLDARAWAVSAEVAKRLNAPAHETNGKLPQETRQALYNFKQSISGDAMEREYEETRRSYQRMMENGY